MRGVYTDPVGAMSGRVGVSGSVGDRPVTGSRGYHPFGAVPAAGSEELG